ncbi:MAG: hypothetical protein AAF849_14225 [Bacteroidota bacterium]
MNRIYEQTLKDGKLKFGTSAGGIVFSKLDSFKPRQPHEVSIAELDFSSEELRLISESLNTISLTKK